MWTKNNIPDLSGKTAIVTGANAGIGFETALGLYEAGAHVVLACRSSKNADQALAKIQATGGKGTLETGVLELSSLTSVKQFADTFLQNHMQLDVLINNAGVMTPPASKTAEGYELQFGVNFLGHFALTGHMYPLLNATSGSRIVTLSSLAYLNGAIEFDNLKSEKDYDAMREYCQSKLADLLFSVELQRRITATGGQTTSLGSHPGATMTELIRHMSEAEFNTALERFGTLMDAAQGALSTLYAAVADEATGGDFYAPDQDGGIRGYPTKAAIAPIALDEAVAQRLWGLAEEVTGIHYPA